MKTLKRFLARQKAVRRLFAQYRTEWSFGWHDPNPHVRAGCRLSFPVEYVARVHRGELFPEMKHV